MMGIVLDMISPKIVYLTWDQTEEHWVKSGRSFVMRTLMMVLRLVLRLVLLLVLRPVLPQVEEGVQVFV